MTGPNTILNRAVEAFRRDWQASQSPRIEHGLAQLEAAHPGLIAPSDAFAAFLTAEVAERKARGESPQVADYANRFRDEKAEINRLAAAASGATLATVPAVLPDVPMLDALRLIGDRLAGPPT